MSYYATAVAPSGAGSEVDALLINFTRDANPGWVARARDAVLSDPSPVEAIRRIRKGCCAASELSFMQASLLLINDILPAASTPLKQAIRLALPVMLNTAAMAARAMVPVEVAYPVEPEAVRGLSALVASWHDRGLLDPVCIQMCHMALVPGTKVPPPPSPTMSAGPAPLPPPVFGQHMQLPSAASPPSAPVMMQAAPRAVGSDPRRQHLMAAASAISPPSGPPAQQPPQQQASPAIPEASKAVQATPATAPALVPAASPSWEPAPLPVAVLLQQKLQAINSSLAAASAASPAASSSSSAPSVAVRALVSEAQDLEAMPVGMMVNAVKATQLHHQQQQAQARAATAGAFNSLGSTGPLIAGSAAASIVASSSDAYRPIDASALPSLKPTTSAEPGRLEVRLAAFYRDLEALQRRVARSQQLG